MDFLAIGDIVIDTFIQLEKARISADANGENAEIALPWGDKIPYKDLQIIPAVGNSPNAAVAAARLGLHTGLSTYVGDDTFGKQCLEVLAQEHILPDYVITEPGKKTNSHYVLSYQSERTILIKHEAFSYAVPSFTELPKWIYLSSLSDTSLPFHQVLTAFLTEHPEINLAFQPGTFQMSFGVESLKALYERSTIFFCNKEESERILGLPEGQAIADLLEQMRALGPKIVVITDGRNGAYAFDGEEKMFVPMYPDSREPFERTGAGDAFASTVTAALALGKPLKEALLWGPINSMSVVQEVGAQKGLLSREQLESYLAKAPKEYALHSL